MTDSWQLQPNSSPGFSNEIWVLIASFLGKNDLKSLLSVPHALSRIASQKLFQKIDLHFGRLSYIFASYVTDNGSWLQSRRQIRITKECRHPHAYYSGSQLCYPRQDHENICAR